MSSYSAQQTLITTQGDGTALTAASAASCLPALSKLLFPANNLKIGDVLRATWAGRISCVVTTPGTARFDLRMGSNVIFDTGALNLNVVAKTNVPFLLEVDLFIRAVGASTSTTALGIGKFTSEAVVGAPANSAGGNGVLCCPVGAPAVGAGWDCTTSNVVDSFFTQTVATGSMTLHNFSLALLT